MPIEKLRPSFSFDEERIKQLKQIAPEAFADNQVNWEVLKEALGNYLEEDDLDVEHFGLFWPGKREARRMASIPSKGTLVPCPGEGIDEENTRNIFIEGENLEVLKILQKSYAGRIKMIYIDPPYNTGNDFVYDDDFTEPLEEYLRRTRQIDEEGKPLTTNKKSDGRFHSKWLSMMYPRLRLARNLISDDGVIFISIDDNEIQNLKQLSNEIFGEENFIGCLVWEKKKKGAFLSNNLTNIKEYVLVYSKTQDQFNGLVGEKASQQETYPVIKTTNTRGTRKIPKGIFSKYKEKNHIVKKGTRISSGNMELILQDDLIIEDGILKNDVIVDSNWIYSQKLLNDYAEKNELYITQDLYFRRVVNEPRLKKIKDILPRVGEDGESGTEYVKNDNLFSDGWGTNEDGNAELHELLGIQNLFDFPKPSKLLSKLAASLQDNAFIALDFFAGSGTFAQSIYSLNKENDSKVTYICIQLQECFDEKSVAYKAGYKSISELAKERVRKSIENIKSQLTKEELDLGFKVYKLSQSNLKIWTDYKGNNVETLQSLFTEQESIAANDIEFDHLFVEILLLEGFPLDSKIEELKEYKENKVHLVISDFSEHKLVVCLDKKVHSETIKNLQLGDTDVFICLDNAITDEEKVTLADKGLIKTL